MRAAPIVAVVVIVAAIAYGALAFKQSLVAYVPFADAINSAADGQTVQIIGALVKGQTHYDSQQGALQFEIAEAGTSNVMPVVFNSPKPDNFDSAAKVTAIGHYDANAKVFQASNLLVKCPSKYADARGTTRAYGPRSQN